MQFHASLYERFWSKVVVGGSDECWFWQAGVRRKDEGYGAFWLDGRHQPAHRVAWMLTHGSAPQKGIVVCHRCDQPRCCNPVHLFLGTPKQNNDDKVKKRRHVFGERVNTAKLTEDQVVEIRAAKPKGRAANGYRRDLALRFDVSVYTISDIWGRPGRWSHLE